MSVAAMEPPRQTTAARARLREQAAVLAWFDVEWLVVPGENAVVDEAISDFLVADCRMVRGDDGKRHWALTDRARSRVARELGADGLRASLRAAQRRPSDTAQGAIERVIEGHGLGPAGRSRRDIAADLQVTQWFVGAIPDLPDVNELSAALERAELLEPLRALTGNGFYGRAPELVRLHAHMRNGGGRPLVISGVGGVGKSTLLAEFVTDVVDANPANRFAYLNFDRGALTADRPTLLLAEIVRQVSLQEPGGRERAAQLVDDLRAVDVSEQQARGRSSQRALEGLESGPVAVLMDRAMDFLAAASRDALLIVLDTFEEVQRQRSTAAYLLWTLLSDVTGSIPSARVVISGRALDVGLYIDAEVVELLDLDDESAMRMLLEAPGVSISEVVARRTIDLVSRNPLSLRLAIDILRNSNPGDPLLDLELQEGQIQGQLYRRILLHIDDPDVRKLAHPGLVARVVTPEVIQHVLARPCGLRDVDPVKAQELFVILEREATLVRLDGNVLRHRSDVRELMLPSLERDQKPRVERLHRAAIHYYRDLGGTDARAEELYHRLMLGQSRRTIDKSWDPAALPSLLESIRELPPRGQAYLWAAAEGSISVSDDVLRAADDQEWAHATEASALAEVRAGRPELALSQVQVRRGADGESLLPTVEVQALEAMRRFEEALDVLGDARVAALRRASSAEAVSLTLARVRVLERMADFDRARGEASELRDALARGQGESALDYLVATTAYLRLLRRSGHEHTPEYTATVAEAAGRAELLPRRELATRAGLLRELLAEIGDASPKLLAFGVREVGVARGRSSHLDEELTKVDATDDSGDEFANEARSRTATKLGNFADVAGFEPGFSGAIRESYQAETDDLYS